MYTDEQYAGHQYNSGRNFMNVRPLYFADEIFYWARTGRQSTVLEIQCGLAAKIDPLKMGDALLRALGVHTNFRIRPIIARDRFQALVDDVENPPLYEEDGRIRHLGTAETEGLMLYVTYGDGHITLHIFHGLSDFRGILAFLNTLLKFYFYGLGQTGIQLPEPDSADTIACFEDIVEKGAPGKPLGMYNPREHDIFHLPEVTFGKWTTKQHIYEIDVPLEPLLSLSRQSESSVVPTLQAFIGRAIRKTYDVGDKIIIGYTPVDLRPIFNFKTSGNASSNFPIPYTEEIDCHDLQDRAMFLRSRLDVQIQPENLYAKVKGTMESITPVLKMPLPVGVEARIILNAGRKIDRESYTYGMSYAGKVRFGPEIDPHVTSVSACAGSYSYPVWILACEFEGTLRMVFTQSYESDVLVKNIFKELSNEIPGTSFADRGHHEFDEFHLRSLRRLSIKTAIRRRTLKRVSKQHTPSKRDLRPL